MLLLTLVPVVLVSLFFTAYLIQLRNTDAEANLASRGENLIKYMSASAELAIYSSNLEALMQLSSQLSKVPDIAYIAFLDARKQRLMERGVADLSIDVNALYDCVNGVGVSIASWRYYCAEVFTELPVVDDIVNDAPTDLKTNVGWVVLAIDTSSVGRYQRDILITSIFVGALVTLLGGFVTWRFSLRLSMPIRSLAKRTQSPDSVLPASSTLLQVDELLVLAEAIDSMLGGAERDQRLLREKVDQATEELRALNTDLEKRNTLLRRTQKKLEVAAKSKDMFLARISHELRTPLTTVMGFAGLLKTTKTSDVEQEYLQNISDATHGLLYIIDDILTLSKMNEGKLTIDQQLHEVDGLLSMLVNQHGFAAAEKQLELLVNIERDVPAKIVVDDQRLRQILTNFISNSIKFTERGEIVLEVRRVPDKHAICFEVRDSGMGFDPKLIRQLLEPFSQADETISRRFGGSGLGLAIAKQLAELLGGSIELLSEVGKGTRAMLYLPIEDAVAPSARRVVNAKVIAFDPSSVVRSSWRRTLTQFVSHVVLPANWAKFMNAVETSHADIVLIGLSVELHERAKLTELITQVRAIHEGKIALLYQVGVLGDELVKSYQQDKDVCFLHKPLLPGALVPLLNLIPEQEPLHTHVGCSLSGLRILLVEDQKIVRRYMQLLLQHYGAEVAEVEHGAEALMLMKEHAFDIVLSDLHMPGLNGEQLFKQAQTILRKHLPPFYIVTADNSAKEHQRLLDLGVTGVISKPIDEQDFINRLGRHQTDASNVFSGDQGLLTNLVDISDVATELVLLSDLVAKTLAANDWHLVQEHVHKIKGLAGVAHLPDLVAMASSLMDCAKAEDRIAIATQLDQLRDMVTRLAPHKDFS